MQNALNHLTMCRGLGKRCLKSDGYTDDHLKITEKKFFKKKAGSGIRSLFNTAAPLLTSAMLL